MQNNGMNIMLVRHGVTDWNTENRIQGIEDIDLNEIGIIQADKCGQSLSRIPIHKIIASPLIRAIHTAKIIAKYLNIHDIEIMPEFIERDYGKLSGLNKEQREQFSKTGQDPCLEKKEDVQDRVLEGIKKVAKENPNKNVLIITHGGVINAILTKLTNGEVEYGIFANTSINYLREENGIFTIEKHNIPVDDFVEWYK